jgi:hypothetical protein
MSMMISDLETTQDLDRKTMAATRGGHSDKCHYPPKAPGLFSRNVSAGRDLVNDGGIVNTGDNNLLVGIGNGSGDDSVTLNGGLHF